MSTSTREGTESDQLFLAEPHVATIAIGGAATPLAVPIWYDYSPGGDLWIATGAESLKARRLRASGGCTLVVDTVTPRTRYVSVECELESEGAPSLENTRALAERYLPAEQAAGFVEYAEQNLAAEARFVLRPVKWRSADLTM